MSGFNSLTLLGNLATDPKQFSKNDGKAGVVFPLYVNTGQTAQPLKIDVYVPERQQDAVMTYLTKGSQVLVNGPLGYDRNTGKPRMSQAPDGRVFSHFEMNAFNVTFVGSASGGGSAGQGIVGTIGNGSPQKNTIPVSDASESDLEDIFA